MIQWIRSENTSRKWQNTDPEYIILWIGIKGIIDNTSYHQLPQIVKYANYALEKSMTKTGYTTFYLPRPLPGCIINDEKFIELPNHNWQDNQYLYSCVTDAVTVGIDFEK